MAKKAQRAVTATKRQLQRMAMRGTSGPSPRRPQGRTANIAMPSPGVSAKGPRAGFSRRGK